MPFKSDKQRRYLWSQKPEVAKQIAHKDSGGPIPDTWWNKRMAGTPQFRGFIDDKDNIYEEIGDISQYDKRFRKKVGDLDYDNAPSYYDTPIYYKPQYRMQDTTPHRYTNEELKELAKKYDFKFNEGGEVPMMDDRKPSKVTQKDRWGNSITMEYQPEVKPIDPTALAKAAMEQGVDGVGIEMPEMDHPGEPRGTDTVPAWLTPGEFVVNAEAAEMYGPQIEAMNNHGRAMQQAQGGPIPRYSDGGKIPGEYSISNPESYHVPGKGVVGYSEGGSIGDTAKDLFDWFTHVDPKVNVPPAQQNVPMKEDKSILDYIHPADLLKLGLGFNQGGQVPFIVAPRLNDPVYQDDGGWITEKLLDKLAEVESGGDNEAVSPVGALGMYQWMPKSAAKAGYGVEPFDPKDPKAARAATRKYLKNMQKHHGFTPEETLRAYNWGPGNVINHKKGKRKDIPAEALNYPGKILGIENTEGVTPQGDDILQAMPTARPNVAPELPVMRAEAKEEMPMWKSFMNDYILGEKTQFKADGGGIPHFDTLASEYTPPELPSNVVPALTDVPKGHKMFGGNETMAGVQEAGNIMADDFSGSNTGEVVPESVDEPWYSDLLGHKSKEMLNIPLSDKEKDLAEQATATSEKLAGSEIAEEENAIADGWVDQETAKAVTTVENDIIKDNKLKDKKSTTSNLSGVEKDAEKDKISKKIVETGSNESTDEDKKVESEGKGNIEAAGIKAPNSLKSEAFGALKDAFGDLFDKKELARMAIMYAGSRLLGGSHNGSLKWAAGNYLERVDAKESNRDKFAKNNVGKFTNESLEEYKKTGNLTSLVQIGATPELSGEMKTFFNGKNIIRGQKAKIGKQTVWVDSKGKPIDTFKWVEDKTRIPGSTEYNQRVASEAKNYKSAFVDFRKENAYGSGDDRRYATDMSPDLAGKQTAAWSIRNNVAPEQMTGLIQAAYDDMKAHKIANPKDKVNDITPYLNARYVKSMVGDPTLFDTADGKMMNTEQINQLGMQAAQQIRAVAPAKFPRSMSDATIMNQFYTNARQNWAELNKRAAAGDEAAIKEIKKAGNGVLKDESVFYNYAESQLADFISKNN